MILAIALGCEFNAHVESGPAEPPKPKFWVTHALSFGGGPYFYATREVIPLPDGTGVVCVATIKDLWCKEVTDEGLH
jgi:hypothetical protein